jgi:hypothetical protein
MFSSIKQVFNKKDSYESSPRMMMNDCVERFSNGSDNDMASQGDYCENMMMDRCMSPELQCLPELYQSDENDVDSPKRENRSSPDIPKKKNFSAAP